MDWDGTITRSDTITALARIGYEANARKKVETLPWSEIVAAYLHDLAVHKATYKPAEEDRTTVDEEYKYLVDLKAVELQSARRRVAQGGVFENVTAADLDKGAKDALASEEVQLRPGWHRLFSFGHVDDMPRVSISVISVNWSATFIRNCLRHCYNDLRVLNRDLPSLSFEEPRRYQTRLQEIAEKEPDSRDPTVLQGLELYAGEVHTRLMDPNVPEIVEFYDVSAMHTSSNKLIWGLHKVQQKAMDRARINRKDLITIYVGDSMGDFHCLLAADVGICIRDTHGPARSSQIKLTNTFKRVGVEVRPLKDLKQICSEMDYEQYQAAADEFAETLLRKARQIHLLYEGDDLSPQTASPTEEFQRIAVLKLKAKQGPEWRGVYWTDSLDEIADLMDVILALRFQEKPGKNEVEAEEVAVSEDLKKLQTLERHKQKQMARRTFHCHHYGCVYAPDGMRKGFPSQYNLDRHLKGAHGAR